MNVLEITQFGDKTIAGDKAMNCFSERQVCSDSKRFLSLIWKANFCDDDDVLVSAKYFKYSNCKQLQVESGAKWGTLLQAV